MNKLFVLAILLSLNASVFSVFLAPGILDQKTTNRTICQNTRIQSANPPQPYIKCGTGSSIKIVSAEHLPTRNIAQCPEQFLASNPVTFDQCRQPVNNNVTVVLQQICNLQSECAFTFQQLVGRNVLNCISLNNVLSTVLNTRTYLQVVYYCDNPRRRFRPFSNKRFDPKFSPSLFHHVRHPSNNRFVPV